MRSIVTIFVVVFTVVLSSLPVVHSQEGGGVAFETPPGQSPIQAEDLPMDLVDDFRIGDTEDDQQ